MDNINRDPKADQEDKADAPKKFVSKLFVYFSLVLICIIILLVVVASRLPAK